MSAFIVTKLHVCALLNWYRVSGGVMTHSHADRFGDPFGPSFEERTAAMLYAENVRSVNYRYPSHTPSEPEVFTNREVNAAPMLSAVQALKAIQCLVYQSCECPDFDTTPAASMLERMKGWAISKLPGYDAAPWGIDSREELSKPTA